MTQPKRIDNPFVAEAKAEHQAAAQRLVQVVREQYPPGTLLVARLGARDVTLQVADVEDSWWYRPGRLIGKNIHTNALRKFSFTDIKDVIYRPGEGQEGKSDE